MVTGSNYLLESGNEKILIDCGLQQGGRYCEHQNFESFPYNPEEIKGVFITHSHLDHIGRLPKLIKDGFKEVVYSTVPTRAFSELLLEDSESILRREAEKEHKKPIYERQDVQRLMKLWQGVPYRKEISLGAFRVKFYNAGHILGSSFIEVSAEGKKVIFSGDLGNSPAPLIEPIEYVHEADYCLVESTYGNRFHEPREQIQGKLEDVVEDTIKTGGTLMIPAFAMERTQDLLFHLERLVEEGRVPRIPIFIDSPLAIKLTEVYKQFTQELNKETKEFLESGNQLFSFPGLKKTLSSEESRSINNVKSPKIIIAGAGMSQGGRILHHEHRYLSDPKSTILFIGYQVKGSLGRKILEGAKSVEIFGDKIPIRCHIREIGGYSAHADQPQLIRWLREMRLHLKQAFVVQGEDDQSAPLAQKIKDELAVAATIPSLGETLVL